MEKGLHVVSRQEKYGKTQAFNWSWNFFKELLNALGCEMYEREESSDRFEVEVSDYEEAMEKFDKFLNSGGLDNEMIDDIEQCTLITNEQNSCQWILDTMKAFYEERDKNEGFIVFVAY